MGAGVEQYVRSMPMVTRSRKKRSGLALQHRIQSGHRQRVKWHLMQHLAPEAGDVAMQDLTLLVPTGYPGTAA